MFQNKEVTCRRTQCPSLDGCHMILYENIQDNRKCCEMCKGCTYQNKEYASRDQWSSPDDPCVQLSCRVSDTELSVTIVVEQVNYN